MTDSSPAAPAGPTESPPRRRLPNLLVMGLLGSGVLLLCGLLAAWGMVEALAHGPNGLSWDPPSLHATGTATAAPPTKSLAAILTAPALPPTKAPAATEVP